MLGPVPEKFIFALSILISCPPTSFIAAYGLVFPNNENVNGDAEDPLVVTLVALVGGPTILL